MFLFWILIIVGTFFFFARLNQSGRLDWAPVRTESGALEILKARYARGEIGRAEFQRMSREI